MDIALNDFLKNLCTTKSRCLVGEMCKQAEILQDRKDLTSDQKISLLKTLNKELIYENFRDLKNSVIFYLEGREYQKIKIYNPTKDNKS